MIHIVTIILFFSLTGFVTTIPRCPALAIDFHSLGINCEPVLPKVPPSDSPTAQRIREATVCQGYKGFVVKKNIGCSSPILPPEMDMEYPCNCKFGGQCKVFCKDGYKLKGSRDVSCLKDGTWSALPECIVEKCQRPKLQAIMLWDGKCSCKVGSSCNLTCVGMGYRITPSPQITCLNKVWSPMPTCEKYCYLSEVPPYLEAKVAGNGSDANCTGKENHYCTFSCKNGLVMYGTQHVKCVFGSWKYFPSCGCDLLTLPPTVVSIAPNCRPTIGSSCDAKCAQNYAPENNFKQALFCDVTGKWDLEKSIKCVKTCKIPIPLPTDVRVVGSCSGRQNVVCKVACIDSKMKLVGGDSFRCLPSGEYSEFPNCVKDNKCSDKAFGKELRVLPGCRYLVGETCHVKCADVSIAKLVGSSAVTCKPTLTWTEIPKCRSSCKKPDFDPNLEFGLCELQEGKICQIRCKEGYAIPKHTVPKWWKIFTCLSNGAWDTPPFICEEVCPDPKLENNTVSTTACINVKVGGSCRLTCRHPGFILKPTRKITCLEGRKWSNTPKCHRKCLPPNLPPYLELVPGCTFLEFDRPCAVRCINPSAVLIGQSNIACTEKGMFLNESSICGIPCKFPELPKELKATGCTDLGDYIATCNIVCADKENVIIGNKNIQCADGVWEIKAKCEKRCPAPTLQPNTTLVYECLYITNFPCLVKCINPAYTLNGKPTQTIVCTKGFWNWTAECDNVCPDPQSLAIEKNMIIEPNCPRTRGSQCEIKCLDGKGSGPFVTCEEDFQWHPKKFSCETTCERMEEQPFMALADHRQCNFYAYEKCYVKCTEGRKLIGDPFFYCQESGTWSTIPTCGPACPDLPDYIQSVNSTCLRTYESNCTVACVVDKVVQPKKFVNYCTKEGTWDKPWPSKKECMVPEKVGNNTCKAPADMILHDCVYRNMYCYLECKNKSLHIHGGSRVFCDSNGKLILSGQNCTSLEDRPCNASSLPGHLHLKEPEPYEIVMYHSVFCNPGYDIMKGEKDKIVCEPGGNWGDLPICVRRCSKGELAKFGFQAREGKGECFNYPGMYCPIDCLDSVNMEPEKEVELLCREEGKWAEPLGGCVPKKNLKGFKTRCGKINSTLRVIPDSSNPMSPERMVTCLDGEYKEINGPHLVKCLANDEYSKIPECKFKKYFDKGENQTRGRQCKYTSSVDTWMFIKDADCMGEISPVGSICRLYDTSICEEEVTIVCMKNLEWSKPTCKRGQYYENLEQELSIEYF